MEWRRPSGMQDGIYRYEVYVIVGSENDESAEPQLHRENGRFEIRNGIPVADVELQREWRLADESLFPPDRTPMVIFTSPTTTIYLLTIFPTKWVSTPQYQ